MLAVAAAGGALTAAAALVAALGPAGPWIAATLADGRAVWRLGVLDVEGVAGAGLGDLRVDKATLRDERGVWAEAEGLTLAWKPLRLLLGDVALTDVAARRLTVFRPPVLSPPKPPSPVRVDATVASLHVERIVLAEGVAGGPAVLRLEGGARTQRETLAAFRLTLRRLDAPLDAVEIDYRNAETVLIDADIRGAPGGAIAALLRAPDSEIAFTARASGNKTKGAGEARGSIGRAQALSATLSWSEEGWRGAAEARPGAIPLLAGFAARTGPVIAAEGAGEAPRPAGAPFSARVSGQGFALEARGRLNEELDPVGAVAVVADLSEARRLAPELGLDRGGARFDGAVEFEGEDTRVSGRLAVRDAVRDGFGLSAEGPVRVVATPTRVRFTAALDAQRLRAPAAALERLLSRARLTAKGDYDRTDGALALSELSLTGPNLTLRAAGTAGEGGTRFRGEWRLPRLATVEPSLRGAVNGRFTLAPAGRSGGLALTAEGAGRGFAGQAPLGDLLGPSPRLNAEVKFEGGDVVVPRAVLSGRQARLGARGRIGSGRADIRLEASAKGPARIGDLTITGAADATGRVYGPLSGLRLQSQARVSTLDVAGLAFTRSVLSFDLAPTKSGYAGGAGLEGFVAGKPAKARARLVLGQGAVAFEEASVEFARLRGQGRARFSKAGPEAHLDLSGVLDGLAANLSGGVAGAFDLTPAPGAPRVALEVGLTRAQMGDLAADRLTVSAQGPLERVSTRFALDGWAGGKRVALTGSGEAGFTEGVNVRLGAAGTFAGAPVATRAPISVSLREGALRADGALKLGDGAASFGWRSDKGGLQASARFEEAPLDVLTAVLAQPAAGRISGTVNLRGARQNLTGDADITLKEARLARRSRDSIDARITGALGGGFLRGRLEARSRDGLVATLEADAPVKAAAAPFRLAAAPGGAGALRWSAQGPVAGLWALFGPLDQSLTGVLSGEGRAQFGDGDLRGQGRLSLRDGGFEDKPSGVKLRAIETVLAFDDSGVRLERFSATDGAGGRLSGSGRLNGRLDLELVNMRLVDRADAKARGGGKLALEWREAGVTLTGRIDLTQAEVKLVNGAAAPAPILDVVEINRPGPPQRLAAPSTSIPVRLDVRVYAPNGVFTRTRGLDAEWSMDVNVRGGLDTLNLFGEARVLRGDFSLGGRRFNLEEGVIRFAGPAEQAEVDIRAVAETADLTATVRITGEAADPEFELSSDPALPEDEILPQLLFGRSAADLSALEAAQLAASLASLTGRSAFDIAGAARAAVALDRLQVRQDAGGVLVAGGKYLTRDVYLEVSRDAAGATSTAVEWQVRPRFFLISSFLPEGDQRVSLRWRREY